MTFSCDICDRQFTEKRSLTRHVKNQRGNLCHRCNQSFNRCDNYEMNQLVCLFKTNRKRSSGHLDRTAKKLKDINRVGGALNRPLVDYHLDHEGEQQDDTKVLNLLRESTFQLGNRISVEVAKQKAIKVYLSSK